MASSPHTTPFSPPPAAAGGFPSAPPPNLYLSDGDFYNSASAESDDDEIPGITPPHTPTGRKKPSAGHTRGVVAAAAAAGPALSSGKNVRVAVRIRPAPTSATGEQVVLRADGPQTVALDTSRWQFDHTLGPDSTQEDVFALVRPLVMTCLDGYSATVLAYGQTNSGKTHTMLGPSGGQAAIKDGVIPRVTRMLFAQVRAAQSDVVQFQIRFQFIEIYKSRVIDLLDESREFLKVRGAHVCVCV
jgi:hypothetical protein